MPRISTLNNTLKATNYVFRSTLSETTNFSLTSGTIEFLALSKLFSLPSQVRLRPGD